MKTHNVQLTQDELQILCDFLASELVGETIGSTQSDDFATIISEWRAQSAESEMDRVRTGWGPVTANELECSFAADASLLEKLYPVLEGSEAEVTS